MNLALIGYTGASLAYGLFALLLLVSWRKTMQGGLLTIALLVSALWAGVAAQVAYQEDLQSIVYQLLEVLHYAAWFLFLLKLFEQGSQKLVEIHPLLNTAQYALLAYILLMLVVFLTNIEHLVGFDDESTTSMAFTLLLFLPISGLVLIEQLIRNVDKQQRWASKFLFFGIGSIFIYDFFLYSHAIMFNGLDPYLWQVRGYVSIVAVPLIAISIARNQGWSPEVYVSRDVVLHSTTIVGVGFYLILMSLAGFYINEYGGSWGAFFQIIFLSLSLLLLTVVVFSRQLRAKYRVFLGKHFYKNKYDYRFEWLRLTQGLSSGEQTQGRFEFAINALAAIVNCRSGGLWVSEHTESLRNISAWSTALIDQDLPRECAMIRLLKEKAYVVNIHDVAHHSPEYEGLELPGWLNKLDDPWLIVPLFASSTFMGFIVLSKPLIKREINWEDRDLLKVAAKQIANYIEIQLASDALGEAKQFEAFNRLSAFMVHDLKNISSELRLLWKNGERYRDDLEFIEDAFETIHHAANEIDRVVKQLKGRHAESGVKQVIDLVDVVHSVIDKAKARPQVVSQTLQPGVYRVECELARLVVVLKHLVDNAQEATNKEGLVQIMLSREGDDNILMIKDNGAGMSADFIRERLFKPFDTTKGNAGMGIGMYESRDFVRGLHGDISVVSEEGIGTKMMVRLPSYSSSTS